METQATKHSVIPAAQRISDLIDGLVGHWLLIANIVLGVFVVTPWLAPMFMHSGWIVSDKYFSGSGFQQTHQTLVAKGLLPKPQSGGQSCGV